MLKDLKFEYPQQLEMLKAKSDILALVEEEEWKLDIMSEIYKIRKRESEEMSYENYYNIFPEDEVENFDDAEPGKYHPGSWWTGEDSSGGYLFDQDVAELHFESEDERYWRIREIWLDLKRKNVIKGPDSVTTEEQIEL